MTNISTLDYVENFTVSKSLSDRMWKLNFTLDKEDAPSPMIGIRAFATDYADVEHCLFVGFVPSANHIRQIGNNKVNITAYDFSWYLSTQTIEGSGAPFHAKINGPLLFCHIACMLGHPDYNLTGVHFCETDALENTCTNEGYCNWTPETSKMKAIEDMCNQCNKIWWIRFKETSSNVYKPCATCVAYENIDNFLPAMVTFTASSDYVIDIGINIDRTEEYNRIIVYGTDPNTGVWYTKIEEIAAVTAGEEKSIDYVYESEKLTTQSKVDAKATDLYAKLYTTSSDTYTATLTNRYDLELLQKVKFVGYSDIPEIEMRISAISYQRQLNNDRVVISFAQDQPFTDTELIDKTTESDTVQIQEQVTREAVRELPNVAVGEITAIDGNEATITLERTGESAKARILT